MANGAHVILTTSDPKGKNRLFVCISNRITRDFSLVPWVRSYNSLPDSVMEPGRGVHWSPWSVLALCQ